MLADNVADDVVLDEWPYSIKAGLDTFFSPLGRFNLGKIFPFGSDARVSYAPCDCKPVRIRLRVDHVVCLEKGHLRVDDGVDGVKKPPSQPWRLLKTALPPAFAHRLHQRDDLVNLDQ